MQNTLRSALRSPARFTLLMLALAGLGLSACGSSDDDASSSSAGSGKDGGTISVVSSAAPDSVDPQVGITGQARAAMWVVNTPLLTFRHADGVEGGEVVPGLATALPVVSDGGRTYRLTLREDRRYSDGTPVRASDFAYAIKRALRLNWPEASSFTGHIVGADAFLARRADDISGIRADDATGEIEIHLNGPYGGFSSILALPAAAPIPSDTPLRPQNTHPPLGDGPYQFDSVTPNGGYTLVKNTRFVPLPDVPAGHADAIRLTVNTNVQAAAEQVLDNQVDVFSPSNTVPPLLVQRARREAADRFKPEPTPNTSFFFFGVTQRPFSSLKARQAVLTAIDFNAFAKFASGLVEVDCWLTPSTIKGHPDASCPYHAADAAGDVEKAKQLVQESGMAGEPVTVFSQSSSPRRQYANYMVDVLNEIGFDARPKLLTPSVYYGTIGNADTRAQMGFVSWAVGSPYPSDMWLPFQTSSGPALNYGGVDDARIDATVPRLNAQQLDAVADQWASLDEYGVDKAYYAAFGHDEFVKFFSNRVDFEAAVFSPLFQVDYSSLRLK